ncbi:MAG: OsmC family protein [Thermoplasmatales archaeon]
MRGKVEWMKDMTFLASGDSNRYTILDFSDDKEQQKGSSPTEMLLQAMCGCTAMDVLSILKKKREPITGLEVKADGTRSPEHPKVFTSVNLEYVVYGRVKQESLDRAIALSQEKYCNISIVMKRAGVNINVTSKIIDDSISPSDSGL